MSQAAVKQIEEVLDALCHVARPIMLDYMGLDSCIASSCIGQAVLRDLGVPSQPMAVKVAAFNRKGHEYMLAKKPDWVREQRDGAYSVGAGYGGPDPHKWDGHLVLIASGHYLVDLSADQMDRPDHDLHVRAFYSVLPSYWDTDGGMALEENGHGTVLIYKADAANDLWRVAPDWSVVRWADVIVKIRQAVARHLGGRA